MEKQTRKSLDEIAKEYGLELSAFTIINLMPELIENILSSGTEVKKKYIAELCSYDMRKFVNSVIRACIAIFATSKYEDVRKKMSSLIYFTLKTYGYFIDEKTADMLFDEELGVPIMYNIDDPDLQEFLQYRRPDDKALSHLIDKFDMFLKKERPQYKELYIVKFLIPFSKNKIIRSELYDKILTIGGKYVAHILIENPMVSPEIKAKAKSLLHI
jgi:hypothetical protein